MFINKNETTSKIKYTIIYLYMNNNERGDDESYIFSFTKGSVANVASIEVKRLYSFEFPCAFHYKRWLVSCVFLSEIGAGAGQESCVGSIKVSRWKKKKEFGNNFRSFLCCL